MRKRQFKLGCNHESACCSAKSRRRHGHHSRLSTAAVPTVFAEPHACVRWRSKPSPSHRKSFCWLQSHPLPGAAASAGAVLNTLLTRCPHPAAPPALAAASWQWLRMPPRSWCRRPWERQPGGSPPASVGRVEAGGDWANVDGSSPVEAAGAQPAWLDWPECNPSSKGKARTQLTPAVHPAGRQRFALTLTLPGYSRYSLALGIRSPVPTRVMGTTGTYVTEHKVAGRHSFLWIGSLAGARLDTGRVPAEPHMLACHGWDAVPVQKAAFTATHELRLPAALHAALCMLHYKWGPTPAAANHSAPLILHQGPT